MDISSLKLYLNYVQDVLGIKQIFMNSSVLAPMKIRTVTVLIFIENLKTYSLEENTLLEKMISALRLEAQQFLILEEHPAQYFSGYQLYFLDDVTSSVEIKPQEFKTWSPRLLLQKPELKKEAWAVMQSLLQKINS